MAIRDTIKLLSEAESKNFNCVKYANDIQFAKFTTIRICVIAIASSYMIAIIIVLDNCSYTYKTTYKFICLHTTNI